MRPSSVCIPVAKTSAAASPPTHVGAAEDEVARLEQPARSESSNSAARRTGCDSPVSVDRSTSSRAFEQPGVGGDPVALVDQEDVARHQRDGVDPLRAPSRRTVACCGR